MRPISAAIKDILQTNPPLRWSFQHRILNLSALAILLKPLIEARTKKEVQVSAIVMNLSRLQRQGLSLKQTVENFRIKHLSVQSNLCSLTYYRTDTLLAKLRGLYSASLRGNPYLTVTQGTAEVTLIFDQSYESVIKELLRERPRNLKHGLAGLGIQFDEKYSDVPGFIYFVVQQISMQNINIAEVSSTFSELVIYVQEDTLSLAFDTLFNCFCDRRRLVKPQ